MPRPSSTTYPCRPSRFLSYADQLAYKYQLDLDGHGGTFRFKHLLLTGSLVFKVDSPMNQFWMPQLIPWVRLFDPLALTGIGLTHYLCQTKQVHYIPVRWHDFETDLVKKVEWAVANDAAAKSIMLTGRKFAQEELSDALVVGYQEEVCY